jgi:hypothetical protein
MLSAIIAALEATKKIRKSRFANEAKARGRVGTDGAVSEFKEGSLDKVNLVDNSNQISGRTHL